METLGWNLEGIKGTLNAKVSQSVSLLFGVDFTSRGGKSFSCSFVILSPPQLNSESIFDRESRHHPPGKESEFG